MKKIILIVEDMASEQAIAKQTAVENGFAVVLAANLTDAVRLWNNLGEKICGVVTDLHFPEKEGGKDVANPTGLAIVMDAVVKGIPVSVCSNIDHHYAEYLKVIIAGLEKLSGKRIPFTMDRKDWGVAIAELKKIIGG